jgi:PAS domain S-box-containing protein
MVDGRTEAMARQLEAAQAITHVGSWEWDLASGSVAWSDELYRIYGMAPRSKPITLDVFLGALVPEDRDRIQAEIQSALARGGRFSYRERIARPDGTRRVLDTIGEVITDQSGKPTGLLGTCRDVTEEVELADARYRVARIQESERQALELLAGGAAL